MIQLSIIGVYLALLLGLGLFANRLFRGTSKDYLLASHTIGPFLLLMSLFGTTMTAFALVGSTGESFKQGVGVYGMLASSSGIIHSLCFFVIGVKLWSFGRRNGYRTQIQFFPHRVDSDKIGLLLFPILVGLVIPYLLIGVMAAGTVINSVTEGAFSTAFATYDYGVPNWIGSLVICGVVSLLYGGMRGTAWANTFQTIVFMILGVVTFFIISNKLGGLQAASNAVLDKYPSKMMREVADSETEAYDKARAGWETLAKYNWSVKQQGLKLEADQAAEAREQFKPRMPGWERRAEAVYAQKNGMLQLGPEEQQRALITQDDRLAADGESLLDAEGRPLPLSHFPRSSDWAKRALTIFQAKIGHPNEPLDPSQPDGQRKWSRKKALGIYRATNWAPEEPRPINPWRFFTYLLVPLSVGMFPHLFQHWLTAKSASSFKLPVVAHPLFIMIVWVPCVLVGVWATTAVVDGRPIIPPHFPANAVSAKMVKELTGPALGGFLTAGILAAIMSSLDSQFLCLGTIFTTDIVMHYGGKNRFGDRQQVLMARLFIVAIVAITYLFSLAEPRRVFQMGVWCFSGFSSLFPLVFASVYWKRLTAAGACASVLAAIISWGVLFYMSDFAKDAEFDMFGMMPVATMVGCSTLALVVVSLLTRPPSKETLSKFFPEP